MTSEKQITANRENGKKGGVKTNAGKTASKMNALKHAQEEVEEKLGYHYRVTRVEEAEEESTDA